MPHKLEITLPSDREIRITRSFDAPRKLVMGCAYGAEAVRGDGVLSQSPEELLDGAACRQAVSTCCA